MQHTINNILVTSKEDVYKYFTCAVNIIKNGTTCMFHRACMMIAMEQKCKLGYYLCDVFYINRHKKLENINASRKEFETTLTEICNELSVEKKLSTYLLSNFDYAFSKLDENPVLSFRKFLKGLENEFKKRLLNSSIIKMTALIEKGKFYKYELI